MTNITELAQSLKRRAASANEFGESLYVKADDVIALVEALEKAQQLATQQGNIACALFDEVTAQRQRIAELEEAEQQLCAANVTLDARAELAERQLAELESRTVTVKLPQRLQPGADGWDDWYVHSDDEGEYLKFDDVLAMLTSEGIKWEAE